MNGITILETIEITEQTIDPDLFVLGLFILMFCSLFFGSLVSLCTDHDLFGLFTAFAIIIIGICVIFSSITVEPTGKYQYRCTIDDSVSINDLTEKYRIIERNGDVYLLEEICNQEE